jgi:hypothetical protein
MIMLRRMKWTEHVAIKGAMRNSYRVGFWWDSEKENDSYKDLDVAGWIILKCILEK